MAGPIYKLWMCRPTEAWYQKPQEERSVYMTQTAGTLQQAGGKSILTCTPLWSNERWALFGVEEFPDLDAVAQHAETLFNMGHYRLIDSFSLLGTKWPADHSPQTGHPTMEGSVFKVWMTRPIEAWYRMSEEERKAYNSHIVQARQQVGGTLVILCASGWSNEQWMLFGVEEFPSVEAGQRYTDLLLANDHYRYTESVSILGTLWQPE